MASSLPILLKDSDERISLVLDVPLEFTTSKIIGDVIEAVGLDYVNAAGEPIQYVLQRRSDGWVLPSHITLGQAKITLGETLYISRAVPKSGQDDEFGDDYYDESNLSPRVNLPEYFLKVRKLQAAGSYEGAIALLMEEWVRLLPPDKPVDEDATTEPIITPEILTPELQMLDREIGSLFVQLVTSQRSSTNFKDFYELLERPDTKRFFSTQNHWRESLTDLLIRSSYELGQQQRYQDARDLAVLALQLDNDNEFALVLESLAHQYVTLKNSDDPEERLDLARNIYQIDSTYGNITEDLRNTVRDNRVAFVAGAEESLGLANPRMRTNGMLERPVDNYMPPQFVPPKPPSKKSFVQTYYWWIIAGFGLLAFLSLMMFLLVSA